VATLLVGERSVDADVLSARIRDAFVLGPDPGEPPRLVLGTVDEVEEPDPGGPGAEPGWGGG
jgi:hypothetical protein